MTNSSKLTVACLLLIVTGSAACRGSSSPPAGQAAAAVGEPVMTVEAVRVTRGEITQRIFAPGSLAAQRSSQIGAEVRGRILEVYVSEGDRVESGDPLFALDARTYEMALREAQAALDVGHAERQQLESDLSRARALGRQDVVAKQEVERLTTKLEVAKARERQATEAVALAQHNLDQTIVRAPFAGSVAARLADEGTTALTQPQTIILILQETAHLEARAAIPESEMARVHTGDRALIRLEGITDPVEGLVGAVSDTIDETTRTYLVKIPVENPDYQLKAGVFAHVEILPAGKNDALLVPRDSIRTEEGRSRLLIVRDGRAEAVDVEVGMVSDDSAEILRGVMEGDEVITGDSARTIAPGLRVRVASEDRTDETG
jgi:RND family efflux transporter MFP subunit